MPGRIVVGVDGSPNSISALRRAGTLASRDGGRLHVIFVYAPGPSARRAVPYGPVDQEFASATEDVFEHERAAGLAVVRDCLHEAFGRRPPVPVEVSAVAGNPRLVLSDASRGADLLVLGARGHSHALGLRMGSTAHWCTTHAACPVLVFHPDGARVRQPLHST